MASRRIAFVGEGKTDLSIFESALQAIPGNEHSVITQIQPPFDALAAVGSSREFGGGWVGVLRWCFEHRATGEAPLRNTILTNFDVVVVHLDSDIASEPELSAVGLVHPCPPASEASDIILLYVASLLEIEASELGESRVVPMIPSQATETWIIGGFFASMYVGPPELECHPDPAMWLYGKVPRFVRMHGGRLRKNAATYVDQRSVIAGLWPVICENCSSARTFFQDLSDVLSLI